MPGRAADAETVIATALGRTERDPRTASGVAAQGALHLLAAVAAARQNDASAAQSHIVAAAHLAGDDEGNALWTAFGPTNVRLHELAVAIALGRPAKAIQIGETLDTERLPVVLCGRRAQAHIDLAMAWSRTRRADGDALLHLLEAERIAPETVHIGHAARAVIANLVARRGRRTPGLVALAARAGLPA